MKSIGGVALATKFEHRLRRCLAGSKHSFLFDQTWVEKYVGPSGAIAARVIMISDLPVYEFSGGKLTTEELVASISVGSASNRENLSHFRSLTDAFEKQRQGLILIQGAEKLSNSSAQLLGRLISFVKKHKLSWKFILIAKVEELDESLVIQLAFDRRYVVKGTVLSGQTPKKKNSPPRANNRLQSFLRKL